MKYLLAITAAAVLALAVGDVARAGGKPGPHPQPQFKDKDHGHFERPDYHDYHYHCEPCRDYCWWYPPCYDYPCYDFPCYEYPCYDYSPCRPDCDYKFNDYHGRTPQVRIKVK